MKEYDFAKMEDLAYQIRQNALTMIISSQWGHPGGSLSCADILAALYGGVMKYDPKQPLAENRDRLVMSKAHSSPALYGALAAVGYISEKDLEQYCLIGGLDGHLDCRATPGVDMSGGSLGCGLSTAVGMAWALKKKEQFARRVYCIVGDGELSEGQNWEAGMTAAQYRLDNLTMLIDYNKVMAKGAVYTEVTLEPLKDKLTAFGYSVYECDGHDVRDIVKTLDTAKKRQFIGKPTAIICHTVKGWGVDDFEYDYNWHTHAPHGPEAEEYRKELAQRFGKPFPKPVEQRKDVNHIRSFLGEV